MGVNSPHYVGNTWPSNEGSYNWDAGLLCSLNEGMSSAFSRWSNAGRGSWAPHLGAAVVLKHKLLCFLIDVVLDACLELHVWDASFKPCIWALKWCWDTSFKPCVWALKWCWDTSFKPCVLTLEGCWGASFKPCVLALHEWLWLTSRLKHGLCYLMTCL